MSDDIRLHKRLHDLDVVSYRRPSLWRRLLRWLAQPYP